MATARINTGTTCQDHEDDDAVDDGVDDAVDDDVGWAGVSIASPFSP